MSGVVRTVGRIAGAVASVASLIPGGQLIAGIAGAVSVVAGIVGGSGPQPAARGSVSDVLIEANAPTPIGFGQSYIGGALIYEEGYGQDDDIPNPFLAQSYIYSNGPIESIIGTYSDFTLINFNGNEASGYYNDFMFRDLQLGSKPESNALALQFSGARRWGASYGLSGYAAGLFNLRFDREGERFASKRPTLGVVGRWNKCYDPRLDSTRAGGNGSHRLNNPATHTWTRNPALAALQYGLGFYTNGLLDFGIGWPLDSLVIEHFIALANICDINGWTCDGHVFEPANKWDNFNDILAAAGARGSFVGGRVGIRYNAPRIAVDVIGPNDLAAGEISVQDGTDWASRLNTLIPRYRMPGGQWPYVDGEAVSVQEYIDQDGEVKEEGLQFNMVTNQNQAAQLAAYVLVNGRELGPISLTCKERFRNYSVGDVLTLDLGDLDDRLDNVDCIIERRVFNPATMSVTFDLTTETDGKHDFALGRTDIPPALPELPTGEEFDRVAKSNRFVDLSTEQVGGELPANKADVALRNDELIPSINSAAQTAIYSNVVDAPNSLADLDNVAGLKLDGIADNATNNRGFLADLDAVDLAQNTTGVLPVSKAVPELINTNITVDGDGVINGIGTANISVDNRLNDRIINLVEVGTGKVEGNSVSKTGGFGQNGGAYSREASTSFYASCFYDFATLTGSVDFGLSNEATPDGTDRNDFLCRIAINGNGDFMDLFVGTVGFARFTVASGALPSSGVLTIIYEGQNCSFFVNGILLAERLSQDVNTIVRALIMPTFSGVLSKLDNISYGPANNTLWDAIAESENRPADRATSNIQLQRFGPRASDVIVVGNSMSINANSNSSGVYTSVCRQKTALFQVTYNGFRGGFLGLYDTSDYDFPASSANFGRIGLNIGAPNANGQVSCGLFYREAGPTVFAAFFSRIFNVGDQLGFICDGTHYHFTVNGAINHSIRAVNNNELKSYIIINGQPSTGQFPFIDIDWLPYTDNALASLGGLGLAEENIRNPIINANGTLEVVKGDGSRTNLPGQVTLGGIGAGAVATLDVIDENHAVDELKNSFLASDIQAASETAIYSNVIDAPNSLGDLDSAADTKLGGIEIGADVTSNQQIIVSPPTPQIIYRNFDGTPKTNQFPLTLTPQITKGSQDVRTSNEVSYTISANGVTATINNTNGSTNKGRITVTGGGAGNIQLIITVNNVALPTYSIPFTVQDDPPPQSTGPTGSTSGSDSSLAAVNSNNSDVQMTGTNSGESIFLINLTTGQRLIATAPLIYQNFSPSPTRMIATWQYRLSGSATWIDFGTRLPGTQSSSQDFGENEIPGQINVNQNRAGLTAGMYQVRLIGRTDVSGGSLTHISGTATVRAGT